MKSATIPSLRVEPELRKAAENVLREGETLSGFMEASLRAGIRHRIEQQEFIARGLAAKDEALQTGEYYSAETVHDELRSMLSRAEENGRK
ncbi:YlcI/YnfO family protein [Geothermobacter hydrogeniphilus]|uniref:Prevent-host-death protein n=1 Tax=Geothermobacter hydrogeniphilus TaxID=1969733 RepID=A0A1X0Y0R5_9BACT|nr:YlcI/YnfO family protein [Geothermobacter hydrogeniphilus]ORJ58678.1 prevent-host-death protein [Geothermobacter hydrogeniphilus]